jgi:hypothetical protein
MILSFLAMHQALPGQSVWPNIIRAVTDPFSLLALIVLVLGTLGYSAVRSERKAWPRVFSLLIVVAALTALGLNAARVINVDTKGKAETAPTSLSANIVFRGSHRILTPLTVPFQVGSGQVNFGCGDSAHPVVTFNPPASAREINATAQWINTSNVKGQDQRTIVAGASATAYGNISGLDRDWIGNCPGGGHGELILKGTYVIDQPSALEPITKTIRATLAPGAERTFDLPIQADQTIETCEITVASEQGTYGHVLLRLRTENQQILGDVVDHSGRVEASVTTGALVLRVQ